MTESTMSVTEAARNFSDLINRVRYRHESALLTKGGQPVARVVPVGPEKLTLGDFVKRWESWEHMTPEEADAFAKDLEAAPKVFKPLVSPWD